MRNLRGSRVLFAAVVVVVLGGLYALAGLRHPISLSAGSAPAAPRSVPVTSVTRVCPAPGAQFSRGGGIAVMASPGSQSPASQGTGSSGPASSGSGAAVVTRLAGQGRSTAGPAVLSITKAGTPRLATVNLDRTTRAQAGPKGKPSTTTVVSTAVRGGVVVQASGALAQGLDVEQTAGTDLPTAACSSPGTDFWFAGPGQRTAGRIQVYLMNASSQAADADVDIFTDAGPLQDTTDNGITVPPHGMIVQSLAPVLRNSRSLALHVRTSVGQVAAAVQESTGTGEGAWLPAAQAPSTHLVIPGLPAAAGSRNLYLSVPGVKDANVSVSAVTSRGTYEPTGAGGIDIPGGSAAEISLPSLAGIPAAIKLTASAPVAATIMIPGGTNGSPGSFTAAAPAIEEQGVIADNVTGAGPGVRADPVRAARHGAGERGPDLLSGLGAPYPDSADQFREERRGGAQGGAWGTAWRAVRGGDLAARGLWPGLRGPRDLGQRDGRRAAVAAPGGQFAGHDPAPPGPQRGHLRRAVSRRGPGLRTPCRAMDPVRTEAPCA